MCAISKMIVLIVVMRLTVLTYVPKVTSVIQSAIHHTVPVICLAFNAILAVAYPYQGCVMVYLTAKTLVMNCHVLTYHRIPLAYQLYNTIPVLVVGHYVMCMIGIAIQITRPVYLRGTCMIRHCIALIQNI